MNIKEINNFIRQHFERELPDVVVLPKGYDSYDEIDQYLIFEVLRVTKEDKPAFRRIKKTVRQLISDKYGVQVMIHNVSPESTEKFRSEEYKQGYRQRLNSVAHVVVGYTMNQAEWPRRDTQLEFEIELDICTTVKNEIDEFRNKSRKVFRQVSSNPDSGKEDRDDNQGSLVYRNDQYSTAA